jgi:hypothetical protein
MRRGRGVFFSLAHSCHCCGERGVVQVVGINFFSFFSFNFLYVYVYVYAFVSVCMCVYSRPFFEIS